MRLFTALTAALLTCLAIVPSSAHGESPAHFDLRPVKGVLQRLLQAQAAQIELGTLPPSIGQERFRIANAEGRIRVEGSTPSALLFGVNWYLKYVVRVQISTNGVRLDSRRPLPLPLPRTTIAMATPYSYRYALNQNTDGYSSPYWDWPRWEHEIDVLAISGVNAMIVERGMDSVLYRTFRDFGYSDAAIRAWITQPAHQNWQLMGNMCCFDRPISRALLEKRAASARKIIARLRELGITPVLPGFFGIVPADFAHRFPGAHVVPQGEWAGFTRPGWLDPRDPMFARLAADFYRRQSELYGAIEATTPADHMAQEMNGASSLPAIYDMEVFQEGGHAGDVPVPDAARAVQQALLRAHPDARWMMLAWQGNPRQDLLRGIDRSHLLIIDIDHDRVPRDDRQKDFQGAPFLFGGIWAFGGRSTLGTNIRNYAERLPRIGHSNSNMVGTAVFPEGMDSNPFAFDLFTEMAWRNAPVDIHAWTTSYVQRRYGAADPHALAAWRALLDSAYAIQIDAVPFNSERDAAHESLFDAQPSLDANRASTWSPEGLRYRPAVFRHALTELLQVAPAIRTCETYQYDLVDVARQTLANESHLLLPQIKAAYLGKDRLRFDALAARWLQLMQLQDELLASNRQFLLGTWLAPVDAWASSSDERRRLHYDARSLLTTWGERKASDDAGLHDYGNKDWAGLTRDYYRPRWQVYFDSLDRAMRTGIPAKPIDWFAVGENWNRGTQPYATTPSGDTYAIAQRIDRTVGTQDTMTDHTQAMP